MKRLILSVLISGWCASHVLLVAQKFEGNEFCLIGYQASFGKELMQRLEPALHQDGNNMQSDKMISSLTNTLYDETTKQIMDQLKVYTPPPDEFGDKAKYDQFGYPLISIQRAIKASDAKYFFKMELHVDEANPQTTPENSVLLKFHLSFYLYNKYGYMPIKHIETEKTMEHPAKASLQVFDGLLHQEIQSQGTTLKELVDEAASELCIMLQN